MSDPIKRVFHVTTAGRAYENGEEVPSFGTLADAGILSKRYEAHSGFSPDDVEMWILWTVQVACLINGQRYKAGDVIEWPK